MFTMGNFLSKDYSDYVINSLGINMNDGGMPTSPRILQLNKGKQYDKITKIKESFGKEIVISYTKSEKQ
ncbi:MAG: hypothetical protein ACLVKE_15245 [Clostridium baratii]